MLIRKLRSAPLLVLLANALFIALLFAITLWLLHRHLPAVSAHAARRVDTVVIHYISGINVDPSRWDDPGLAMDIVKRYGVSAHYLVARTGAVCQLVQEHDIAWHAGGSVRPAPDNRRNVNRFSIGIEVIATARSGFSDAQYQALARLIRGIEHRHLIVRLVEHDDIAGVRAIRLGLRRDETAEPGPLFV